MMVVIIISHSNKINISIQRKIPSKEQKVVFQQKNTLRHMMEVLKGQLVLDEQCKER